VSRIFRLAIDEETLTMEMMILDGVEERRHVRQYVRAVIGEGADRDVFYAT
jgi:hypothetical protein